MTANKLAVFDKGSMDYAIEWIVLTPGSTDTYGSGETAASADCATLAALHSVDKNEACMKLCNVGCARSQSVNSLCRASPDI